MLRETTTTLFCVILACLKYTSAQDDGSSLYSRRYERLDIDTILSTPRLVTNYVECLLNKKPCPPEGKALKRILPEALRTKCGRCWPIQKEGALKVITKLYFDYPEHYNALREKWDTTGEYHRRFLEYLRDQKFNAISNNGDLDDNGDQNIIQLNEPANKIQKIQPTPTTTTRPSVAFTLRPQLPAVTRVPATELPPRPTRQDEITQSAQDEVQEIIGNRFGDDVDEFEDNSPAKAQSPRTPAPTPATMKSTTPRPIVTKTTNFQTQNPILNIINRISMKFTNTAEFIASMLRGKMNDNNEAGSVAGSR